MFQVLYFAVVRYVI